MVTRPRCALKIISLRPPPTAGPGLSGGTEGPTSSSPPTSPQCKCPPQRPAAEDAQIAWQLPPPHAATRGAPPFQKPAMGGYPGPLRSQKGTHSSIPVVYGTGWVDLQ
ncbi:hypothetical protein NDU88_008443 [Pleurodeles waltl]|uniref:Uncharacterized protein n=1 Tax=Pleurodeles waltl TaxID=8319 RepID=A0AAV7PRY0_PLEWA|nr:hypothetical protein NDU88_008443 [Pleurodeles waltl]